MNTSERYDHVAIACPRCGSHRSGVRLTRSQAGTIYRRRKCTQCKVLYTTAEQYVPGSLKSAIDMSKLRSEQEAAS